MSSDQTMAGRTVLVTGASRPSSGEVSQARSVSAATHQE